MKLMTRFEQRRASGGSKRTDVDPGELPSVEVHIELDVGRGPSRSRSLICFRTAIE
jgi:hypothetical protein